MSTTSPAPFPSNGARKLSPKELFQQARAAACTMPKDKKPSCSGQVFVGVFFDGTGNNMQADFYDRPPEKRKHTNVVKLFQTFPLPQQKPGHFPIYIPGVGTPFPEIGDKGGKRGSATAAGGEQRITWALMQLINAPHRFVNGSLLLSDELAATVTDNMSSTTNPSGMRGVALRAWQDKLKAALAGRKPEVAQLNVSVFGFSRGAAQARTFVNWLFETCEQKDGGWTFAGIPIRLQFLGIFDTVASVGAANLYDTGVLAGHQSWADNTQEIHPAVERCVHYVAGHEVRACFPLDSVRVKSNYPSNALEVMYPGAHSDVGGGYAPGDLGVASTIDCNMSIIPGVSMYKEALLSAVPLKTWHALDEYTKRSLTATADTIKDFNAYVKAANIGNGPVEEVHRKHMGLYFSYRFKYLDQPAYRNTLPYKNASSDDKILLYSTQRNFWWHMTQLKQKLNAETTKNVDAQNFLKKYGAHIEKSQGTWTEMSASPSIWKKGLWGTINSAQKNLGKDPMASAWEVCKRIQPEAVKPEVENFFNKYIHDSMAGFIGFGMNEYAYNKIGITKFRTVFTGND